VGLTAGLEDLENMKAYGGEHSTSCILTCLVCFVASVKLSCV